MVTYSYKLNDLVFKLKKIFNKNTSNFFKSDKIDNKLNKNPILSICEYKFFIIYKLRYSLLRELKEYNDLPEVDCDGPRYLNRF